MADQETINEMVNRGNRLIGRGPRPMERAPRDGTHILGYLYSAPDDCGYRGFGEWREIYYKEIIGLMGMRLCWHAGDPDDGHTGNEAPEHYGEGVPIAWLPLPPSPLSAGQRGEP